MPKEHYQFSNILNIPLITSLSKNFTDSYLFILEETIYFFGIPVLNLV